MEQKFYRISSNTGEAIIDLNQLITIYTEKFLIRNKERTVWYEVIACFAYNHKLELYKGTKEDCEEFIENFHDMLKRMKK